MPCYVCEKCGCIDNTALGGNYWSFARISFINHHRKHKEAVEKQKDYIPALCCECNTGQWHGHFKKLKVWENDYYLNHVDELLNPKVAKRFIEAEKSKKE